jgi:ATP-dependent protease ClpP protease subunit
MKIVDLYNEISTTTVRLAVTDKDYKVLERLKSLGGFKRFGLSIYDNSKTAQRQRTELLNFLSETFLNKPLIKTYFNL